MSCWIKSAAIGYNSYHIPLSFNGSNYEFSIDSSGYFRNGFNINGTRSVLTTSHTSILDNKWHMITATYDGNVIRRYVDGKELTSYATSIAGTLAGGSGNLLIGNYNGTQYGNKEMFMSDVRIYSTALNADDILTLYQGTISLLENGGITAYEFKEDSPLIKMTSTGLLRMDNISEIGYLNRMKTKVLPDGSAWARIFYHKNRGGTVLFSTYDEVMNTDTEYKYSNLYLLDHFISNDGKFEFLLNYTPVDITINYSNKYNRWKQSLNPCNEYAGTADGSLKATGYEAVHIDFSSNYWGGLTR
jgi:hypothetical protein